MSRTACFTKMLLAFYTLAILPCVLGAQEHAAEEKVPVSAAPAGPTAHVQSETLVRAVFLGPKSWARVGKGSKLEGRLSLPLYAGEEMVAPSDSVVRITVNSAEKIREPLGFWRKSGRAIVRAFNPLETNHPAEYHVELGAADLLTPWGEVRPLEVRVLRASSGVMVRPKSGSLKSAGTERGKNEAGNILLMAWSREASSLVTAWHSLAPVNAASEQRSGRAYMLTGLRASTNQQGDTFRAQLAEPVRIGGRVFAPGTAVEGTVVRRVPPRMLSRAGRLDLRVDRIVPTEGEPLQVGGSLSAAEADAQSRFALDEEGTLHGRKPGMLNGLVDIGYAYFVGKVSDDIAETPIRAIGAAMSDAAVANAARYVGLGSSLVFLITRHGRDVYMPQYSLIEIDFGRVNETSAAANVE
jgi:hypothetical protein